MTLRTLNYGNYGIFLIMGNAGFCPSTVVQDSRTWLCGVAGLLVVVVVAKRPPNPNQTVVVFRTHSTKHGQTRSPKSRSPKPQTLYPKPQAFTLNPPTRTFLQASNPDAAPVAEATIQSSEGTRRCTLILGLGIRVQGFRGLGV